VKCSNCGDTSFFVGHPISIPIALVRMENGNYIVTYKDGTETKWTCMKCGHTVNVKEYDNKTVCIAAEKPSIFLTLEDVRMYAKSGASPKEVLSNPSKYIYKGDLKE